MRTWQDHRGHHTSQVCDDKNCRASHHLSQPLVANILANRNGQPSHSESETTAKPTFPALMNLDTTGVKHRPRNGTYSHVGSKGKFWMSWTDQFASRGVCVSRTWSMWQPQKGCILWGVFQTCDNAASSAATGAFFGAAAAVLSSPVQPTVPRWTISNASCTMCCFLVSSSTVQDTPEAVGELTGGSFVLRTMPIRKALV